LQKQVFETLMDVDKHKYKPLWTARLPADRLAWRQAVATCFHHFVPS
jgi:hypothetical protein